jgi:hypothetical protein
MGAQLAAHLMEELFYAPEAAAAADALALPGGDGGGGGEDADAAPPKRQKKLTKTDRNRQLRARAANEAAAAARALKKQRRDLNELAVRLACTLVCMHPSKLLTRMQLLRCAQPLQKEVAAAAAATAERAERRAAARATRAAAGPARLGKRRFVAEPIAVQLSEEVTGSLRQLVSVPTLVRDRYKNFQRRELVEPRAAAAYKRSRSYLQYEPGARGTAEAEMHAATLAEKAAMRAAKE